MCSSSAGWIEGVFSGLVALRLGGDFRGGTGGGVTQETGPCHRLHVNRPSK